MKLYITKELYTIRCLLPFLLKKRRAMYVIDGDNRRRFFFYLPFFFRLVFPSSGSLESLIYVGMKDFFELRKKGSLVKDTKLPLFVCIFLYGLLCIISLKNDRTCERYNN